MFLSHFLKKTLLFSLVLFVFSACENLGDSENQEQENPEITEKDNDSEVSSDDSEDLVLKSSEVAGIELMIPEGFEITEFASGLDDARDLVGPDLAGNFWLSRPDAGVITLLEIDQETGEVANISDIFRNLNEPHGLALDSEDPGFLYYAESDKVSRVRIYSEGQPEKLADLPDGGRHFTRSLHFGVDGRLYVSIGSSCDTCVEEDQRRSAIYMMDKDGGNFSQYASGLRNAVFMATDPVSGAIWVTEMGRDFLGDDLPPDEINLVLEGEHYGWPYCYGDQVRDENFQFEEGNDEPLDEDLNSCAETAAPKLNIQAHSAPLGLDFIPEEGWPEDLGLDLLVAYHGSWNRSEPTGYKIVRVKLDDQRNVLGVDDFVTGWLGENGEIFGRPVDVLIQPGGVFYITDDENGTIYRLRVL